MTMHAHAKSLRRQQPLPILHQQRRFGSSFIHSRHSIKLKIYEIITPMMIGFEKKIILYTATTLEYELFMEATSEKEYMNIDTLVPRMTTQLNKLFLHGWFNGTVVEPDSQQLDGPTEVYHMNDFFCGSGTGRNQETSSNSTSSRFAQQHSCDSDDVIYLGTINRNGFPEGGLSHPPPIEVSVSDMNDLFSVSGAGRNQETSSKSTSSRFAQQHSYDSDVIYLGTINRNESVAPSLTAMEKSHHSESFKHSMQPYGPEFQTTKQPQLEYFYNSDIPQPQLEYFYNSDIPQPQLEYFYNSDIPQPQLGYFYNSDIPQTRLEFESSVIMDSIVRVNDVPSGNSEAILPPTKRQKVEPALGESSINNASFGLLTHNMVHCYSSEEISKLQQQAEVVECNVEGNENQMFDSMDISEMKNIVIDDTLGLTFEWETFPSEGLEAFLMDSTMPTLCNDPIDDDMEDIQGRKEFNLGRENAKNTAIELKADEEKKTESSSTTFNHISEESDPDIYELMANSNLKEKVTSLSFTMHTLCNDPIDADIEDMQGRTESGENAKKIDIELKADQEKKTKSSTETINVVAFTEYFTENQLREHREILKNQFGQSRTEETRGSTADSCQLCKMQTLFFAPVPIYCSCCGHLIKRNVFYYHGGAEEFDTQHCICTSCYKGSQGGDIMFNGTKTLLQRKRNDDQFEEPWVECNRCKLWQHQICALYNNKRDLDHTAEYICPGCRLKDIENGVHVPLPKTAYFGAKDLPRTMLSDHIEDRLFKRLMQERTDKLKVEWNNNSDEVLAAENLSVRVVSSNDKQLKVKKEFLDIFSEEDYPDEFLYRSKAILLFQNIEEVDICLFAMYVQEFGSECGLPNQRCVYISYLDSVKHFRPERKTLTGEALRTFVYHEILIGYLDFCKKRGFTTCYLYACPPSKGEDYLLYGKPKDQKIPKDDKLRKWYQTMLRKASEENIVVGLTNMYDHFFVPTGKCGSKVTAAHLPYFDGDNWCHAAMDLANTIEQASGGYERQLKKLLTKRALKSMGHPNPTKQTAKDILVMHKLGQVILPQKEDFIIVHLQHACMHCHEVIVSGKRWFCTQCKNFQECERCHTADWHTSIDGKKHKLCQALIKDIPFDTKDNEIILDNEFLENRNDLLSFCHKNRFQFDTIRHAKYSTMMIIDHLKNSMRVNIGVNPS